MENFDYRIILDDSGSIVHWSLCRYVPAWQWTVDTIDGDDNDEDEEDVEDGGEDDVGGWCRRMMMRMMQEDQACSSLTVDIVGWPV